MLGSFYHRLMLKASKTFDGILTDLKARITGYSVKFFIKDQLYVYKILHTNSLQFSGIFIQWYQKLVKLFPLFKTIQISYYLSTNIDSVKEQGEVTETHLQIDT